MQLFYDEIALHDLGTLFVSAQETHESIALLDRIAKERELTLLFTEHDMDVVFSIAHTIAVLHQGRIIAVGSFIIATRPLTRCAIRARWVPSGNG